MSSSEQRRSKAALSGALSGDLGVRGDQLAVERAAHQEFFVPALIEELDGQATDLIVNLG
jgi:hypothetical protein